MAITRKTLGEKVKKKTVYIALVTLLFVSASYARDTHKMFSINEALKTPAAKERLDKSVKLYFGDQKHPKAMTEFGEFKTSKKTNGFNKSDLEACQWAFLSAMLQLQSRAVKEGGNAVVNIKSYYKANEISSKTEFECGSGALMSGVAFKGNVVRLAN